MPGDARAGIQRRWDAHLQYLVVSWFLNTAVSPGFTGTGLLGLSARKMKNVSGGLPPAQADGVGWVWVGGGWGVGVGVGGGVGGIQTVAALAVRPYMAW